MEFPTTGRKTPEEIMEGFLNKQEIRLLIKDFEIIDSFLTELRGDMADWTKYVDKPDYKVYYR